MIDYFTKCLKDFDLTPEEIQKYLTDFSLIASLTLVAASQDRLSEEEKRQVKESIESKDYQRMGGIIKDKYSEEEWNKFIDKHLPSLLKEYIKEVVRKS